ncbi:peroxiredoxin family protein [Croceivirga thetidis]|uniref:TlpA family protein disulfide reductase n=1 Tax=Croceivirga thetidis TaxID=2721623 RepID=A0ABX1GUU9_9FLAO|nr:TlpA disulfide reductase family protein [Croceivirga thetidis]NKI32517.1 TlpA family protein disulfide reductase [Croceivirga thetidis]
MKKFVFSLLLISSIIACKNSDEKQGLKEGTWKGTMTLSENQSLPFNFSISKDSSEKYNLTVRNADEKVEFDEVFLSGDSIIVQLSVFDGELKGIYSQEKIEGQFIEESRDRVVPFSATFGDSPRFVVGSQSKVNVSGIWEVTFDIDNPNGGYPAKGIFTQTDSLVTGTFRTNTGDYRYLEGVVDGVELKLSTFDGTHAFLFLAEATDSTLNGTFYSGKHSIEKFVAKRNEAFELSDSNTLTFLKDGFDSFDFSFPDTKGDMISISDESFENKVVLVQILGTWCPNCLDETRYYVDYLQQNPNPDLKMIGLAFEYAKTKEKAMGRVKRLIDREEIPYPILLAQYGGADKKLANEKLPMLNHVLSYPTTIFVDKMGKVRKIHTGFNGPATGEKYEEFQVDFNETVKELLAE